ncbi:MAG: tetratricopeptide repeat protein [Nitrospiraceae bacterium]|nr:MAG: tetratricopeptide repeat protein [Nitrospiraceae bacterium]
MKIMTMVIAVLLLLSLSFVPVQAETLKEAYSLYYKGEKAEAISIIEDYVKDNPEPKAYYFLGYAYYEMQEMDKSREYFTKAYKMKSFYSPMPEDKN